MGKFKQVITLIGFSAQQVGVISLAELRDIRAKTEKGQKHDAVVISNNELERIKKTIVIKSPEKLMEERRIREDERDKEMATSKIRKQKMEEHDKLRQSKMPVSELTHEQQMRAQGMLSRA